MRVNPGGHGSSQPGRSGRPLGRRAAWLLGVIVALGAGCGDSSTTQPAPSASPPATDTLLFYSGRTGRSQLYTIAANGGSLSRVLVGESDDTDPVWSPDGSRIAFVSSRGDQPRSIYTIDAEGPESSLQRVTDPGSSQIYPAWSPDGLRILFTSYEYENADLGRINVDGNPDSQVELTDVKYVEEEGDEDLDGANWGGCWSPDGLRMAFTSNRDANWNIYTASTERRTDPRTHVQITDHPAGDWDPAYSPDGEWIAFVSDRDGNSDIFIIASDGDPATLRRITTSPHRDADPAWSPDGEWIAYTSYPGGRGAIHVVAANGDPSTRQLIVTDSSGSWGPQWRPRP
jgi:Tol biopolymer transport system component